MIWQEYWYCFELYRDCSLINLYHSNNCQTQDRVFIKSLKLELYSDFETNLLYFSGKFGILKNVFTPKMLERNRTMFLKETYQNWMTVQQLAETIMLIRVRFLSQPNLSNQMIPTKKIGTKRTWMQPQTSPRIFPQLFSIMKEKNSFPLSIWAVEQFSTFIFNLFLKAFSSHITAKCFAK